VRAEPKIAALRAARYGSKTANAYRISLSAAFAILRSPRAARSRASRTADTISSKTRSASRTSPTWAISASML